MSFCNKLMSWVLLKVRGANIVHLKNEKEIIITLALLNDNIVAHRFNPDYKIVKRLVVIDEEKETILI